MSKQIGIRHEDKYLMERRTAIIPAHAAKLIQKEGLSVAVETSPKRVFTDSEFEEAGAGIQQNLQNCPVIFGVKEIPESYFEADKTYVFFSHVIKGQAYNMPMLKKMMKLGCNLIDYECIVDDQGKRLIFFGKFAGLAGMINSLWSAGQRLKVLGQTDNPFLQVKQSFQYHSLADAKKDVSALGQHIAERGLPKDLLPFVIGFTGYGNVSAGAQEIANLLPSVEISPEQLLELQKKKSHPNNIIYKVVFKEEHISRPKNAAQAFDLQDYYQFPEKYENNFEQYAAHLSVLMNCMYWDTRYPRILTRSFIKDLIRQGHDKLIVIGDVTCDPDGSVEFTHKGTNIEDPVFVYNPETGKPVMGFEGDGILVMAVDILPSELPRDSSIAFSDALLGFVPAIAQADYSVSFDKLSLPGAIKKALILHKGQLTPKYKYIERYL